jgi:predicted small metal-binding protein
MARLLKCNDIDIECDYICADSEEELLNRAKQYAKVKEGWIEISSEFRNRVLSLSRPIDRC